MKFLKNSSLFRAVCLLLSAGLLMVVFSATVRADDGPGMPELKGREPRPQDATKAILAAFDKHDIVGLTVHHSNKDLDDFILALLRNPAFADKVDVIEPECGNSMHQALLDRYIAGEDVSLAEASKVWRDSPLSMCQTAEFWHMFYQVVREANLKRPAGKKKLRVLAPEPSVDWSQVKTSADLSAYFTSRDISYTAMAQKEITAKHLKGLLLFGAAHLKKLDDPNTTSPGRIMTTLEKARPGSTYVIVDYRGFWTGTPLAKFNGEIEKRLASWAVPSIAAIKGTWMAEQAESLLIRPPVLFGGTCVAGTFKPMSLEDVPGSKKLGQTIDAVLYLGPRDLQLHEVRPAFIYLDQEYMAEWARRGKLQSQSRGEPDGGPKEVLEIDTSAFLFNKPLEQHYLDAQAKSIERGKQNCARQSSSPAALKP